MINPDINTFLAVWDKEWASLPPGAGPKERREHFEKVAANMRLPAPDDVDADREVWVDSAAGKVRVRLYRSTTGGTQPCLIYMHGGGFMQGSPETHADITNRIASWNNMTVISVDYALAPEHPFPTAINQCADVVRWAFENAASIGVDPQRIAVGGDSAGANLAAVMALMFKDDPDIHLAAQLLIYPPVDFEQNRPAYTENADGPLLVTASMKAVNAMYCPDPASLKDPRAAPMLAPDHTGLPPAFIAVAQHDPLRDDGLDYAKKLENAGVSVTIDTGTGLCHGYLRSMEYCADAQDKLTRMAEWLASAIG